MSQRYIRGLPRGLDLVLSISIVSEGIPYNHDDIGHIVNAWGCLPSAGDGYDALDTHICAGCPSAIPINPPQFLKIPLTQWVQFAPGLVTFPVQVKITNTTPISKIICRVVPANWTPPVPPANETVGIDPNEPLYQWPLTHFGDGICNGTVEIMSPVNNSDYRLSFIVENEEGYRGNILSSWVGLNGDGIAPLDTTNPELYITNPAADATVSGTIDITAKGYDDQELDEIKLYLNGTIVNSTTMPDYLPHPDVVYTCDTTTYSNGIYNITAWATDKTGNTNTTSIFIDIQNRAIPSFQFTLVVIGCLLVVVAIHGTRNKALEVNRRIDR